MKGGEIVKKDSGLSLAHLTVLVVDDEAIIEMWLTDILAEAGASAYGANRGADALALIDQHPDIDLLLADVRLPDVTGEALVDEARKRLPDLRVIYLTGLDTPQLPTGAPVLQKPFESHELMLAIAAALSPSLQEPIGLQADATSGSAVP
jgi:CheY-like chemotaxis protein